MIINFLAGPGAGKSTLAAGLFYRLKMEAVNCELVREYAKDLCWDDELTAASPHSITRVQFARVKMMSEKVDIVVHDTSVLLGAIYGGSVIGCLEYESQLKDSYNIFVKRSGNRDEFEQAGRIQNYDESQAIDDQIMKFMIDNSINFTVFQKHELEKVFDHVMVLHSWT